MAKAKAESSKKPSSSKRKAKADEPIVEIDGVELASNEEPKSDMPPPNVIWRGEKDPPPSPVRIGAEAIELPAAEEQRKGFYHEKARRLVRQFGFKYFNPLS